MLAPTVSAVEPACAPGSIPGSRNAVRADTRGSPEKRRRASAPANISPPVPCRRPDSALGSYKQVALTRWIYRKSRVYLAESHAEDVSGKVSKAKRVFTAVRRAAKALIWEVNVIRVLQEAAEERRQLKAKRAEIVWQSLCLQIPSVFDISQDDPESAISAAEKVAKALEAMLAEFDGAEVVRDKFLTVAATFRQCESSLRSFQSSCSTDLKGLEEVQTVMERCAEEAIRLVRLFEGKVGDMRTQLRKTLKSRGSRDNVGQTDEQFDTPAKHRTTHSLTIDTHNTFDNSRERFSDDSDNEIADQERQEVSQDCIGALLESLERDLCDRPLTALRELSSEIACSSPIFKRKIDTQTLLQEEQVEGAAPKLDALDAPVVVKSNPGVDCDREESRAAVLMSEIMQAIPSVPQRSEPSAADDMSQLELSSLSLDTDAADEAKAASSAAVDGLLESAEGMHLQVSAQTRFAPGSFAADEFEESAPLPRPNMNVRAQPSSGAPSDQRIRAARASAKSPSFADTDIAEQSVVGRHDLRTGHATSSDREEHQHHRANSKNRQTTEWSELAFDREDADDRAISGAATHMLSAHGSAKLASTPAHVSSTMQAVEAEGLLQTSAGMRLPCKHPLTDTLDEARSMWDEAQLEVETQSRARLRKEIRLPEQEANPDGQMNMRGSTTQFPAQEVLEAEKNENGPTSSRRPRQSSYAAADRGPSPLADPSSETDVVSRIETPARQDAMKTMASPQVARSVAHKLSTDSVTDIQKHRGLVQTRLTFAANTAAIAGAQNCGVDLHEMSNDAVDTEWQPSKAIGADVQADAAAEVKLAGYELADVIGSTRRSIAKGRAPSVLKPTETAGGAVSSVSPPVGISQLGGAQLGWKAQQGLPEIIGMSRESRSCALLDRGRNGQPRPSANLSEASLLQVGKSILCERPRRGAAERGLKQSASEPYVLTTAGGLEAVLREQKLSQKMAQPQAKLSACRNSLSLCSPPAQTPQLFDRNCSRADVVAKAPPTLLPTIDSFCQRSASQRTSQSRHRQAKQFQMPFVISSDECCWQAKRGSSWR